MNNQPIIPGQVIVTLRRRKAWSRDRLAVEAGIRSQTLRYIEKNKTVPRHQTLEKIAKALKTTPEQMLYQAREEPYDEKTKANQRMNDYGIVKCTASPIDRVPDYKRVFLEASGDIFVSGTSMISLSEDSAYLLEMKRKRSIFR